jgi:hypothetical protein
MSSQIPPKIILGSAEISKIDPWSIDVEEELRKLLLLMEEKINLFVCGIATENSAWIHWKKVEDIMELREMPRGFREERIEGLGIETPITLPPLQLLITGKTTVIDLSEILSSLLGFLEETSMRQVEALVGSEPMPTLREDFVQRIPTLSLEVFAILQRLFEIQEYKISLAYFIDEVDNLKPIEVFIVLLFLYLDELIDLEPLEGEEGITDVIIRPTIQSVRKG